MSHPFSFFPAVLFALATLLPLAATRADDEAEKKAAVEAMTPWLTLTDKGEYGESYDEASAAFKEAVTRADWIKALEDVRKPLGSLESRDLLSSVLLTTLPDGTQGTYVLAQFESAFTDLANANETVTFEKEDDGTWRAAGYFIRPN
ncbi:MAG: DUF4019 domain-containing protein [Chthoniobacterales bacterium]